MFDVVFKKYFFTIAEKHHILNFGLLKIVNRVPVPQFYESYCVKMSNINSLYLTLICI